MNEQLLADLKAKLQVTWEDAETNRVLEMAIKNSQNYLNKTCGAEFTFAEGSAEYELLIERCRYDWNNALDEFATNYQREISALIMDVAVSKYEEAKADEQATT